MPDVKNIAPRKPRRNQTHQLAQTQPQAADWSLRPPAPDSLRDWFASMALEGCAVTDENEDTGRFWFSPAQIASRCYAIADAMLIERGVNGGDDIAVLEAALRDQRIRRALRARSAAVVALARIANLPVLPLKATTTPSKAKPRRAK